MRDEKERVKHLVNEIAKLETVVNLEDKKKRKVILETQTLDKDFWQEPQKAKDIMQEISDLENEIKEITDLKEEILLLSALCKEEKGVEDSLIAEIEKAEKKLAGLSVRFYLNNLYDENNAYLSIHAGQGGTEAMDWAEMLYRMYLRFSEKRGWKAEILEATYGEEAGIKSITISVVGRFAYGHLKGEAGTHRLVRQSPFNADKLRQTSFALVEVLPQIKEDDRGILIRDEDLTWQFFRSSSQGGQNVQKVSTAVRLIHIPSGLVVTAQTERYQEQNRKYALELLKAKLWLLEEERKKKVVSEIKGEYKPASWGNQIRSYVLHPYKMVKDLRTGCETGDTEKVLGGDLDEFIAQELKFLAAKNY